MTQISAMVSFSLVHPSRFSFSRCFIAGDPAMWAPRHSLPGEYTISAQTHNSTYRMRSPVAYLGPEIHPPGPYSDRRSSNDSSLGNGVYSAPAYPGYSLPPMRRREPLPSNSYAMQPVDRRPAPSSYEYYDKESFNTSYGGMSHVPLSFLESDPLLDTTSSSSDLDLSQYEVPIIEDLYSGKEKRTVVMIRNIPNRYVPSPTLILVDTRWPTLRRSSISPPKVWFH